MGTNTNSSERMTKNSGMREMVRAIREIIGGLTNYKIIAKVRNTKKYLLNVRAIVPNHVLRMKT